MADPGQEHRFREWFACPECHERAGTSSLAHGTEIVLECYTCGLISEYVIGRDISLQNLDVDAMGRRGQELDVVDSRGHM